MGDKCRNFIRALPRTPAKPFNDAFASMSPEVQDLSAQMLQWVPESRTAARRAIQHSYLEQLHCPEDEPTREPLDMSEFQFESWKINATALREEIFHETLCYYPDLLEQFEEELREHGSPRDHSSYRLILPGGSPGFSDDERKADFDSN